MSQVTSRQEKIFLNTKKDNSWQYHTRTLQPLLKSLMRDVHSHMAEGSRGRGGICVCVCDVWRNGDPCAVMFKQRFPQQPHAPLVPLSRLRDEAPPLPLTLMHPHAYAYTRTHVHSRQKGISTFDLGRFVQMVPRCVGGAIHRVLISLFDREETLEDEKKWLIHYILMSKEGKGHKWRGI